MNYYRRYPGDYGRETGHLTLAEHGAFSLMLDHCYSSEKPLPLALESIYRLCKAMEKYERAAVDSVLEQFWTKTDAGWTNKRAQNEISKAAPAILAARANGKTGGRPRAK